MEELRILFFEFLDRCLVFVGFRVVLRGGECEGTRDLVWGVWVFLVDTGG